MLTTLFILAAVVLVATLIRRPRTRWERIVVALAAFLMLAVIIAWGVQYVAQNAKAAEPSPAGELTRATIYATESR